MTLLPAGSNGAAVPGAAPVTTPCAGKTYVVQVRFPDARLAYVSLGSGKAAKVGTSTLNAKCPNTLVFSDKTGASYSATQQSTAVAPSSGSWQIGVASATGGCAPFMITTATFTVGRC